MENTNSKLRKALESKGMSPSDFGRLLDINSQTVNNWIKRGVPHGRAIEVAARLGLPLSEISQSPIEDYVKLTPEPGKSKCATAREFIEKSLDELSELPGNELYKLSGIIEQLAQQIEKPKK